MKKSPKQELIELIKNANYQELCEILEAVTAVLGVEESQPPAHR